MQDRDPNRTGLRRAPFIDRSNLQMPSVFNVFKAALDSLSSAGCMIMKPMPSALQSDLRNVGVDGSYLARIGDDVMQCFISLKSWMRSGDHARIGNSDRRYRLYSCRSGFSRISKYGA